MNLWNAMSLPHLLGVGENHRADHTTLPLALASFTMPVWAFSLDAVSSKAALIAPILGVVLVLLKISAILLKDVYPALSAMGTPAPRPRAKPKAKAKGPKRAPAAPRKKVRT